MPILQPYITASSSITKEIKKAHSRVFRRCYIKRRDTTTGLFESNWQEITNDIKRWGQIGSNVDYERYGSFNFLGTNLIMDNSKGRYSPATSDNSLWYGYMSQQRTLIKIEAGFVHQWLDTNGIWHNDTYPSDPTIFRGIISGAINYNDQDEVVLPLKPLMQVFSDFLYDDIFLAAGDYLDSAVTELSISDKIKPFFDNTSSNFDIASIPSVAAQKWPGGQTTDLSVWKFIESMARQLNLVPYITPAGVFKVRNKTVSSTTAFEFYGAGPTINTEYGQTIKDVTYYGVNANNFYSKVIYQYNWTNLFTTTGPLYAVTSLSSTITGSNLVWEYGAKALTVSDSDGDFDIVGLTLPTAQAIANSLCGQIFNEVSRADEEIRFKTTFIPHLNLLDRVKITYDSSDYTSNQTLWDAYNWDTELTWDDGAEGAIVLQNEPFKILSIQIDLDNLETNFVCRALNE